MRALKRTGRPRSVGAGQSVVSAQRRRCDIVVGSPLHVSVLSPGRGGIYPSPPMMPLLTGLGFLRAGRTTKIPRRWRSRSPFGIWSGNPNGIPSISPGLRAGRYPGSGVKHFSTPTGLRSDRQRDPHGDDSGKRTGRPRVGSAQHRRCGIVVGSQLHVSVLSPVRGGIIGGGVMPPLTGLGFLRAGRTTKIPRRWRSRSPFGIWSGNPNGIPSISPGLRAGRYPGSGVKHFSTPTGLRSDRQRDPHGDDSGKRTGRPRVGSAQHRRCDIVVGSPLHVSVRSPGRGGTHPSPPMMPPLTGLGFFRAGRTTKRPRRWRSPSPTGTSRHQIDVHELAA